MVNNLNKVFCNSEKKRYYKQFSHFLARLAFWNLSNEDHKKSEIFKELNYRILFEAELETMRTVAWWCQEHIQ